MSEIINMQSSVVRTNRGLSIAGTRITLYQIMDYIKAGESPELIRDIFRLTIRQTADVMNYIHTHYDEVEKEYQKILKQAEEIRRYWAEHNRERLAEIVLKPEHKEIQTKLNEWKTRLKKHDKHTD